MPKPRSIDPTFWEDLDVIALSRDERLLLVSIITAGADDQGLCKANAPYLKRLVFAFDADISIQDVEQMILHIGETCRNVIFYYDHGERYLGLANWEKYQKIRYARKTNLPLPPWAKGDDVWPDTATFDQTQTEPTGDGEDCNGSAKISKSDAKLAEPLLSRVVLGREEQGSVGQVAQASAEADDEKEPTDGMSLKLWENSVGLLSKTLREKLLGLMDDVNGQQSRSGPIWLMRAIDVATQSSRGSPPNYNYVKAIIDGGLRNGFESMGNGGAAWKQKSEETSDARLEAGQEFLQRMRQKPPSSAPS